MNDFDYRLTTRVSGAAVSRPLDPLVSRFLEDLRWLGTSGRARQVSEPKIPKGFVMIYTETHSICMRIDHIVSVAVAVGVNHTLHITTRDGENYKAAYNFEEFLKLLDAANTEVVK